MPPIQNSVFYNPARNNEAFAGKRSVGSARDKDEEVTMKLDAIADQLKDTVEAIHSNETIQIDKDGKIKVKGMGLDKKHFVDVVGAAEKAHQAKMKELNKKYEKITNKATAYKVLSKLLDDTKKSIVKLVGENIDDIATALYDPVRYGQLFARTCENTIKDDNKHDPAVITPYAGATLGKYNLKIIRTATETKFVTNKLNSGDSKRYSGKILIKKDAQDLVMASGEPFHEVTFSMDNLQGIIQKFSNKEYGFTLRSIKSSGTNYYTYELIFNGTENIYLEPKDIKDETGTTVTEHDFLSALFKTAPFPETPMLRTGEDNLILGFKDPAETAIHDDTDVRFEFYRDPDFKEENFLTSLNTRLPAGGITYSDLQNLIKNFVNRITIQDENEQNIKISAVEKDVNGIKYLCLKYGPDTGIQDKNIYVKAMYSENSDDVTNPLTLYALDTKNKILNENEQIIDIGKLDLNFLYEETPPAAVPITTQTTVTLFDNTMAATTLRSLTEIKDAINAKLAAEKGTHQVLNLVSADIITIGEEKRLVIKTSDEDYSIATGTTYKLKTWNVQVTQSIASFLNANNFLNQAPAFVDDNKILIKDFGTVATSNDLFNGGAYVSTLLIEKETNNVIGYFNKQYQGAASVAEFIDDLNASFPGYTTKPTLKDGEIIGFEITNNANPKNSCTLQILKNQNDTTNAAAYKVQNEVKLADANTTQYEIKYLSIFDGTRPAGTETVVLIQTATQKTMEEWKTYLTDKIHRYVSEYINVSIDPRSNQLIFENITDNKNWYINLDSGTTVISKNQVNINSVKVYVEGITSVYSLPDTNTTVYYCRSIQFNDRTKGVYFFRSDLTGTIEQIRDELNNKITGKAPPTSDIRFVIEAGTNLLKVTNTPTDPNDWDVIVDSDTIISTTQFENTGDQSTFTVPINGAPKAIDAKYLTEQILNKNPGVITRKLTFSYDEGTKQIIASYNGLQNRRWNVEFERPPAALVLTENSVIEKIPETLLNDEVKTISKDPITAPATFIPIVAFGETSTPDKLCGPCTLKVDIYDNNNNFISTAVKEFTNNITINDLRDMINNVSVIPYHHATNTTNDPVATTVTDLEGNKIVGIEIKETGTNAPLKIKITKQFNNESNYLSIGLTKPLETNMKIVLDNLYVYENNDTANESFDLLDLVPNKEFDSVDNLVTVLNDKINAQKVDKPFLGNFNFLKDPITEKLVCHYNGNDIIGWSVIPVPPITLTPIQTTLDIKNAYLTRETTEYMIISKDLITPSMFSYGDFGATDDKIIEANTFVSILFKNRTDNPLLPAFNKKYTYDVSFLKLKQDLEAFYNGSGVSGGGYYKPGIKLIEQKDHNGDTVGFTARYKDASANFLPVTFEIQRSRKPNGKYIAFEKSYTALGKAENELFNIGGPTPIYFVKGDNIAEVTIPIGNYTIESLAEYINNNKPIGYDGFNVTYESDPLRRTKYQDEQVNRILFSYTLQPGETEQSWGVDVSAVELKGIFIPGQHHILESTTVPKLESVTYIPIETFFLNTADIRSNTLMFENGNFFKCNFDFEGLNFSKRIPETYTLKNFYDDIIAFFNDIGKTNISVSLITSEGIVVTNPDYTDKIIGIQVVDKADPANPQNKTLDIELNKIDGNNTDNAGYIEFETVPDADGKINLKSLELYSEKGFPGATPANAKTIILDNTNCNTLFRGSIIPEDFVTYFNNPINRTGLLYGCNIYTAYDENDKHLIFYSNPNVHTKKFGIKLKNARDTIIPNYISKRLKTFKDGDYNEEALIPFSAFSVTNRTDLIDNLDDRVEVKVTLTDKDDATNTKTFYKTYNRFTVKNLITDISKLQDITAEFVATPLEDDELGPYGIRVKDADDKVYTINVEYYTPINGEKVYFEAPIAGNGAADVALFNTASQLDIKGLKVMYEGRVYDYTDISCALTDLKTAFQTAGTANPTRVTVYGYDTVDFKPLFFLNGSPKGIWNLSADPTETDKYSISTNLNFATEITRESTVTTARCIKFSDINPNYDKTGFLFPKDKLISFTLGMAEDQTYITYSEEATPNRVFHDLATSFDLSIDPNATDNYIKYIYDKNIPVGFEIKKDGNEKQLTYNISHSNERYIQFNISTIQNHLQKAGNKFALQKIGTVKGSSSVISTYITSLGAIVPTIKDSPLNFVDLLPDILTIELPQKDVIYQPYIEGILKNADGTSNGTLKGYPEGIVESSQTTIHTNLKGIDFNDITNNDSSDYIFRAGTTVHYKFTKNELSGTVVQFTTTYQKDITAEDLQDDIANYYNNSILVNIIYSSGITKNSDGTYVDENGLNISNDYEKIQNLGKPVGMTVPGLILDLTQSDKYHAMKCVFNTLNGIDFGDIIINNKKRYPVAGNNLYAISDYIKNHEKLGKMFDVGFGKTDEGKYYITLQYKLNDGAKISFSNQIENTSLYQLTHKNHQRSTPGITLESIGVTDLTSTFDSVGTFTQITIGDSCYMIRTEHPTDPFKHSVNFEQFLVNIMNNVNAIENKIVIKKFEYIYTNESYFASYDYNDVNKPAELPYAFHFIDESGSGILDCSIKFSPKNNTNTILIDTSGYNNNFSFGSLKIRRADKTEVELSTSESLNIQEWVKKFNTTLKINGTYSPVYDFSISQTIDNKILISNLAGTAYPNWKIKIPIFKDKCTMVVSNDIIDNIMTFNDVSMYNELTNTFNNKDYSYVFQLITEDGSQFEYGRYDVMKLATGNAGSKFSLEELAHALSSEVRGIKADCVNINGTKGLKIYYGNNIPLKLNMITSTSKTLDFSRTFEGADGYYINGLAFYDTANEDYKLISFSGGNVFQFGYENDPIRQNINDILRQFDTNNGISNDNVTTIKSTKFFNLYLNIYQKQDDPAGIISQYIYNKYILSDPQTQAIIDYTPIYSAEERTDLVINHNNMENHSITYNWFEIAKDGVGEIKTDSTTLNDKDIAIYKTYYDSSNVFTKSCSHQDITISTLQNTFEQPDGVDTITAEYKQFKISQNITTSYEPYNIGQFPSNYKTKEFTIGTKPGYLLTDDFETKNIIPQAKYFESDTPTETYQEDTVNASKTNVTQYTTQNICTGFTERQTHYYNYFNCSNMQFELKAIDISSDMLLKNTKFDVTQDLSGITDDLWYKGVTTNTFPEKEKAPVEIKRDDANNITYLIPETENRNIKFAVGDLDERTYQEFSINITGKDTLLDIAKKIQEGTNNLLEAKVRISTIFERAANKALIRKEKNAIDIIKSKDNVRFFVMKGDNDNDNTFLYNLGLSEQAPEGATDAEIDTKKKTPATMDDTKNFLDDKFIKIDKYHQITHHLDTVGKTAIFDCGHGKMESNSNKISDVLPNISMELRETGEMNFEVMVDGDTVVKAFRDFIDEYNDLIKFMNEQDETVVDNSGKEQLTRAAEGAYLHGERAFGSIKKDIENAIAQYVERKYTGPNDYTHINKLNDIGITKFSPPKDSLDDQMLKSQLEVTDADLFLRQLNDHTNEFLNFLALHARFSDCLGTSNKYLLSAASGDFMSSLNNTPIYLRHLDQIPKRLQLTDINGIYFNNDQNISNGNPMNVMEFKICTNTLEAKHTFTNFEITKKVQVQGGGGTTTQDVDILTLNGDYTIVSVMDYILTNQKCQENNIGARIAENTTNTGRYDLIIATNSEDFKDTYDHDVLTSSGSGGTLTLLPHKEYFSGNITKDQNATYDIAIYQTNNPGSAIASINNETLLPKVLVSKLNAQFNTGGHLYKAHTEPVDATSCKLVIKKTNASAPDLKIDVRAPNNFYIGTTQYPSTHSLIDIRDTINIFGRGLEYEDTFGSKVLRSKYHYFMRMQRPEDSGTFKRPQRITAESGIFETLINDIDELQIKKIIPTAIEAINKESKSKKEYIDRQDEQGIHKIEQVKKKSDVYNARISELENQKKRLRALVKGSKSD